MSDKRDALKAACDAALADPDFQPAGGVTHCNQALNYIALAMDCDELAGICADAQYKVMDENASGRWTKVVGAIAAIHALGGGLAVAALPGARLGEAHGHVAAVYPLGMQASRSLGHDVPLLANVGKTVGVMKSSAAFPVASGEADYFAWA